MSNRPHLTSLGVTVVALVIGAASIGWALGYAGLSIAALGGVIGLAVAAISAWRSPDVDLQREISPVRVERGRKAVALVMAINRHSRRTPAIVVAQPVANRTVERPVPPLVRGRSAIVEIELATHRRGAIDIGPMRAVRRDIAGLWASARTIGDGATLLVQPRIHPIDPRPGGRFRHIDGLSAHSGGGTITFQALREYVAGDDVRQIHWRSSARTGSLMVREHVDTNLPSTVVVLDTRAEAYADADDFESAVDVAASVIGASQRAGYLARLITTDGVVLTMRAGQRGRDIDDFLAGVQLDDRGVSNRPADFGRASEAVLRGRERDAIAVVSGAVDASMLGEVTRITQRFQTRALLTIRPGQDDTPRWAHGRHFDGPDADHALSAWNHGGGA